MEKKKVGLGEAAASAGKAASGVLSKAKKAVISVADQNDDGELDLKDVSAAAESIGTAAKKAATAVKNSAEARTREQEYKTLCPIFEDDLDGTECLMSKLIRLTEMDKRRAQSEICKGSIGYLSVQKGIRIVNVYRDKVNCFGISFYPDMESEVYYVDPSDRDRYISLSDYFGYLKVARVNELQKIAQDLGAKHFKVTYKEQQSAQSLINGKGHIKASKVTGDVQRELSATSFSSVEIAAEMTCPGHAPQMPHLVYLQREPSIQNLIALRMDKESPITHQRYTLKLSNSSGIKQSDAIKVDAVLKGLKCSANTSFAAEAKKEANRFFEYEIDF